MIPRFKPSIGFREILACLQVWNKKSVERFEKRFAGLMGQRFALSFPYGRTGLIFLFRALGLFSREIICPAYTCIVVPHAIVYSGNIPVFIDCEPGSFNMNLEEVEQCINKNTGAIIATSLFGYPVNLDKLNIIKKRYPSVHIIQDCAHSFAAEYNGIAVHKEGIAAIFGLNISKLLTSIFGGMVTTDNEKLYRALKQIRDCELRKARITNNIKSFFYLLALYPAFYSPLYGFVNKMERSGLLNSLVKYYDDRKIDMPKDYLASLTGLEARVGTVNLLRYTSIIEKHRQAAAYYFENLENTESFRLPPRISGATYSHFVVLVSDRKYWLEKALAKGVQLGWLIEYCIPELPAYSEYRTMTYPIAFEYARKAINLPVWGGEKIAKKVVDILR